MAYMNQVNIKGHFNIYTGQMREQRLEIHYAIPEQGTDEETGIVLFVPGYGGNVHSKVYRKMREQFADTYNVVTLQAVYFGSEFMQDPNYMELDLKSEENIIRVLGKEKYHQVGNHPQRLLRRLKGERLQLKGIAKFPEDISYFNDMGFMQAIDLIQTVEVMQLILKQNQLKYNCHRIIGYGHSHGAYLLHLMNRLQPTLFFHIIDNSSWIVPQYLMQPREVQQRMEDVVLDLDIHYLASHEKKFREALHMKSIYSDFQSNAHIISYQGNEDHLVNHVEKREILNKQQNAKYVEVTAKDIDGEIFQSANHGLGADFLKLFQNTWVNLEPNESCINKQSVDLNLGSFRLVSDVREEVTTFHLLDNDY